MRQNLFVGVDGGATKSIVRVEDASGRLLGQEVSGPANIRLSVDQTWQSIYAALKKILTPLVIATSCHLPSSRIKHETSSVSPFFDKLSEHYDLLAGMGLAGCEAVDAYEDYLSRPHPFKTLLVTSDAYTACLGAHGGRDGAIIIIGTGVVGYQIQKGKNVKVGGFGFPQDDDGGGAWLGLEAVKISLRSLDGRLPESPLSQAVLAHFAQDQDHLVAWANRANSTLFAELAPLVIECAQAGDASAINLLQKAGAVIDQVGDALYRAQTDQGKPLPCSLVGGVSSFIEPFLGQALHDRLIACKASPVFGAIAMVRAHEDASLANKATAP